MLQTVLYFYVVSFLITITEANSLKNHESDPIEKAVNLQEKVSFLEALNRKQGTELEEAKTACMRSTASLKHKYEQELEATRNSRDDAIHQKTGLEIKLEVYKREAAELHEQITEAKKWRTEDREARNSLNKQHSLLEGELKMLRKMVKSKDTDRERDNSVIQTLTQNLEVVKAKLANTELALLDVENKKMKLEEDMDFRKNVHEQELKKLSTLAYRDTTAESREYWKNEISKAVRDIQNDYDTKADQIREDLEGFYNAKIQEFRTNDTKRNMELTQAKEESKKYMNQLNEARNRLVDLEAKNSQLEKQYQELLEESEHERGVITK